MPYYGRGGAGNIQAAAQEKARIASDTEAQLSTADESLPSSSPSAGSNEQAYRHSGRGGAGNYYSPSEDAKLPVHQAEIDAASKPVEAGGKYGRGGAGNINFASGEKTGQAEKVQSEEQKMKDRVAKAIENYVEDGLQIPEKARLPA